MVTKCDWNALWARFKIFRAKWLYILYIKHYIWQHKSSFMKNRLLSFLAFAVLMLTAAPSQAAFVVKGNTVTQTAVTERSNTASVTTAQQARTSEAMDMLQQFAPPSFAGMVGRGTIGFISAICGIIGFFIPLFSIGAVILGMMGLGRYRRRKGFAIAGIVLGVIAIIATAISGFAPLAIF